MHTCPKCPKDQIVRFLKVVMDAMCRSPNHDVSIVPFSSLRRCDFYILDLFHAENIACLEVGVYRNGWILVGYP